MKGLVTRRVGFVALLLGTGMVAVLIWTWWLPKWMVHTLTTRLASRGLLVEVGGASLALNRVELHDLRFRGRRRGLEARVERLVLGVAPWRGFGLAAVRSVTVQGFRAKLDLHGAPLQELIKRREMAATGIAAPDEAPARPAFHFASVVVTIADEHGPLFAVQGGTIDVGRTDWSLAGFEVGVGAAPGDVITLSNVSARGGWNGGWPVLGRGAVGAGILRWAGDATFSQPSPAPPPGSANRRTAARVAQAIGILRPLRGARTTNGGGRPVSGASPSLWAADASVALTDLRVVTGSGPAEKIVLSKLSVVLQAQGGDSVRAKVRGQGAGKGVLSADLRLLPRAARAEGTVDLEEVSLALFAPVLPPLPFYELARTRVRAHLSLQAQGLETMTGTGHVAVRDLAFSAAGLARRPVGPLAVVASGVGQWTPARRELRLESAEVRIGALRATGAGALAWPPDGYRLDGEVHLAKGSCQGLLDAVPAALLDGLAGAQLRGQLGGSVSVQVDSSDLDATRVDFTIDDGCSFDGLPSMLDLSRFQRPFIHRAIEPDDQVFEFETGPGTSAWTPIDHVTPFMIQAAVAHEDGRFFGHRGFAEPEIAVALARNLKARAFKFGASTITMQLVKNVFLHRDKLLSRKVQEAYITWWLEQQWDKRHILELYLNVIEYGPGIYGIRHAAWHYFGTIPMNLTPAQSAFLSSILPSPKTMHAQYDAGALSASMKRRLAAFLRHMRARGRIDQEALEFGLEELEHFTFYRPDQPPPATPEIRGHAQAPPFHVPADVVDPWDALEPPSEDSVEDGSFGTAY